VRRWGEVQFREFRRQPAKFLQIGVFK